MGLKVLSFLSKSLEVLGTNGSNKKSLSFPNRLIKIKYWNFIWHHVILKKLENLLWTFTKIEPSQIQQTQTTQE